MNQPKAIDIKSDALPAQEDHKNSPLRKQETFIQYYSKSSNEMNKKLYSSFNSDFSIFLVKIASSPLKKWATIAFDKKLVLLGHQTTHQNIGLVNKVAITNGKVNALVLDADNIGLDTSSENPIASNIDKAVYSTYHAIIRAAINISFFKLRRDKKVKHSLIEWYHIAFLRALDLPTLDNINMAKFDFAIAYFLCRFSFLENHRMAMSAASVYIHDKYADDFENAISDINISEEAFKATKDIKDVTKLFKILELTTDDTMKQIQHILKKVGTVGFITVMGPIDYAIAGIILSIYFKGYSSMLMNTHLQTTIESALDPYLKKLKFGSSK